MEIIKITKIVGVVLIALQVIMIFRQMKNIKEEDPQAYIKKELLLIRLWVVMIFVFYFLEGSIVALAL